MMVNRKKVFSVTVIAVLLLIGFIGFRIYKNMQSDKAKAAAITQGRIATVEVMPAFNKSIAPVLTFTASLEPVWHSDISSKVDGRIKSLYTQEGQKVQAGQRVASLENMEYDAQVEQARGELYAVSADLEQARGDFSRAQVLLKQGAISRQQFDAAAAKVANLEGQLRAKRGNVAYLQARLGDTNVVAPHQGIVMNRYLQSGDYAKTGTAIFSIADTSVMLAKATVGEGQITQLKLGDVAQVFIDSLSDKPFFGKITKIVPEAAIPARTFIVEVSLDNRDNNMLSGLTAKVQVKGKEHANALVVPETALVLFEDQRTIFVLNGDRVVQRKLKIGYVGDGYAEVLSGLKPGELIVVSGQNTIRDGVKVKVAATREGGSL
jgi:RND family efflux transporter MFP subunit